MEFSRQEYWSGLPFSPPGELPDPGFKPMAPMSPALAGRFFTAEPLAKPQRTVLNVKSHAGKGERIKKVLVVKSSILSKVGF